MVTRMHFMLIILVFLLVAVVWGFFQSNPRGVSPGKLIACNAIVLAAALGAAAVIGPAIYADAHATKPAEQAFAGYLGIMAGGTVFMIVVAVGGLVRNLVLFPVSKRSN